MIEVSVKTAGSRRKPFEDFSVPAPAGIQSEDEVSLSDLIASVVRHEVSNFLGRQQQREFLQILTQREITEGRRVGKIESGDSEKKPDVVDVEQAVETALQAFEDGLFYCIVDGIQIERSDQKLKIRNNSKLVFIKLTMLSGG